MPMTNDYLLLRRFNAPSVLWIDSLEIIMTWKLLLFKAKREKGRESFVTLVIMQDELDVPFIIIIFMKIKTGKGVCYMIMMIIFFDRAFIPP